LKHWSNYWCKIFASNFKCANRCYATLETHSYIKYVQHFSVFSPAQKHMLWGMGIFLPLFFADAIKESKRKMKFKC